MRYSVAGKFLAIILCAATLLGAAGSAVGMTALAEQGLYERHVEDAYREYLENVSGSFAQVMGARFASEALGGVNSRLVQEYYGSRWEYGYFDRDRMGYALTDREGNVLQSREMDAAFSPAYSFTIPLSGQYLKVVNVIPESEYEEIPAVTESAAADVLVMPSREVTSIGKVVLEYTDGSRSEYDTGEELGLLRTGDRMLLFETEHIGEIPMGDGWYVSHIVLADMAGNVVYEAFAEPVIWSMAQEGNRLRLQLPAGKVTAQAPAGITFASGDYSSYDAIPVQGITVAMINVTYGNDTGDLGSEGIASPDLLGTLFHDHQGNAEFHSTEAMSMDIPEGARITHISFQDAQGNVIFEARCPGGVGRLSSDEKGCMVFRGMMPGTEMPEETTPEETEPEATTLPEMAITCTAREDIPVYAVPVAGGESVDTLKAGQQTVILQTGFIGGANWALTENGWILLDQVMIRGAAEAIPDAAEEPAMASVTEETQAETEEEEPDAAVTEQETDAPEPAAAEITAAEETVPLVTEPAALRENVQRLGYYDSEKQERMIAECVTEPIPEGYTLEVRLASGASIYEYEWVLLRTVYAMKDQLLLILAVCALLWAVTAVYLCCAAGRRRGTNAVCAGGLNRVPLDLYLAAAAGMGAGLVVLGVEGGQYLMRSTVQIGMLFILAVAFVCSLLIIAFGFAFVAQIKTPGNYWWHNSLCGRCLKLTGVLWKWLRSGCRWLWRTGKPALKKALVRLTGWILALAGTLWKAVLWIWDTVKKLGIKLWDRARGLWNWAAQKFVRFFSLLPVTWQFLLTGFVLVFLLYAMMRTYKVGYILLGFGIFFGVLLYAASAFGILLESARRMSKGDLDTKVDDRLLIGGFRDFAADLNELADVAVVAAQKQMKSERMKTELITNVSHDIKTPLTSIINYVDLMEKPHTPEEQTAYLEVLSRQSQRLKKLIDDLMEMSKASTGNMSVDIQRVNAAEAVNQALGEFGDKLERAQLIPVFRHPDTDVEMMADGRLVWRVMSNLLGNAVKYAMPGTRMYLDLAEMDGKVIISIKNISREELNVTADELLERFVRGDTARNTEGSGLGLNIAKSLMELQKGQLQLLVDGDLFKVTLIFPGV